VIPVDQAVEAGIVLPPADARRTPPIFSTARCERRLSGPITEHGHLSTKRTGVGAPASAPSFLHYARAPQCDRARKVQPISTSLRSGSKAVESG
jgi:hypothetical protein